MASGKGREPRGDAGRCCGVQDRAYSKVLYFWYSTHMTTNQTSVNARRLLLPYALILSIAMAGVQTVIALTGGQIGLLAGLLTAAVALGIVVWLWSNRRELRRVRFGQVVAHAVAFVVITSSFNLHAAIRSVALAGEADGFQLAAHDLLATPWFGATLVMSSVWGLGLLIHLIGAILGRGWED